MLIVQRHISHDASLGKVKKSCINTWFLFEKKKCYEKNGACYCKPEPNGLALWPDSTGYYIKLHDDDDEDSLSFLSGGLVRSRVLL